MLRFLRRALVAVTSVLLAAVALAPWLVYEVGMSNIIGRPVPPRTNGASSVQALKVWLQLKETGPIEVDRLDPYSFALGLLADAPTSSGSRVAWFVARNHNTGNLQSNRMLWWHISGAALTIWLTRNWTADQLLAKAYEILSAQRALSGAARLERYTS